MFVTLVAVILRLLRAVPCIRTGILMYFVSFPNEKDGGISVDRFVFAFCEMID